MQLSTSVVYLLLYFASVTIIMLEPWKKRDDLCRKNMHLSTSASPVDQDELEIISILDIVKNRISFIPDYWNYVFQVDRNTTLHDL